MMRDQPSTPNDGMIPLRLSVKGEYFPRNIGLSPY